MNPPLPPIALTPTGKPAIEPGLPFSPVEMSEPATAPLPMISQRQANWHVHTAGLEAQKAAEAQGVDPGAAAVLLGAACGGKMIAGYSFPQLTAAFVLMLPMLEKTKDACAPLSGEGGQYMAMAFALAYPAESYTLLNAGDYQGFQSRVWNFCQPFSAAQLMELVNWINNELVRLKGDAQEAKVGK